MRKYYLLSGKNSAKVASAFAPEGTKLDHELIPELDNVNALPFEMNLVKLTVVKNGLLKSNDLSDLKEIWRDYQPNSLAWPLMSEKLKSAIEETLKGHEGIDWISAMVNGAGGQQKYYIPRFSKMLDVLDMEETTFVQGTDRVIRPVFSLTKIDQYNVFHKPSANNSWKITPGIYVADVVRKAIQKEKLTGVNFEETAVA